MKFRVLGGNHSQDGKVFQKGDIVETDKPLDKIMANKFVRILEGASATEEAPTNKLDTEVADGLQNMTVAELKAFAADEEIDLGTATKKAEILNTIRAALDLA